MPVRRRSAVVAVVVSLPLSAHLAAAQLRVATPQKVAPAPPATTTTSTIQAPQQVAQRALPTPPGIYVSYTIPSQGAAIFSLGTATNFQFHYQPNSGAAEDRNTPEWSGTIQFTPTNQQATQINSCAATHCLWTVNVSNVAAQGTVTYTLTNVRFVSSGIGTGGVTASFTSGEMHWAPMTPPPVQAIGVSQASAPPGITAMTRAGQYLGPVVTYQVEDVTAAQNNHSKSATGTLQLPVTPQALNVLMGVEGLTLTNATAQGRSVSTLGGVYVTSATLGSTLPTLNLTFIYRSIQYATYTGTSTVPTQSFGWNYMTGQPIQ
jgi:hypothetical protein